MSPQLLPKDPIDRPSGWHAGLSGLVSPYSQLHVWTKELALISTYLGGIMLVVAVIITALSIIGRALIDVGLGPVPGDYEVVEALCGVAVFAFLPLCQQMRGNVTVDILIQPLGARVFAWTQVIGNVIVAGIALFLTWRHGLGTIDKFYNGETSTILQFPIWWGFAAAELFLVVFSLVSVVAVIRDIDDIASGRNVLVGLGVH